MPLTDVLGKIFSAGASDIVGSIGKVIDDNVTSKEEKEQLKQAIQLEVNRHDEKIMEEMNNVIGLHLADIANARAMQIIALQQDDKFSKRFIYYLAAGFIFLVMLFDFLLFFVDYPSENRDIIMTLVGVLNGGGVVMILSFFFGSTTASKQKDQTIQNLTK